VAAASNLIGTMPDIPAIARLVHERSDALVYVDGVHYTAHESVDLAASGADFWACSPYKSLGPSDALSRYRATPGEVGQVEGQTGTEATLSALQDAVSRRSPRGLNAAARRYGARSLGTPVPANGGLAMYAIRASVVVGLRAVSSHQFMVTKRGSRGPGA